MNFNFINTLILVGTIQGFIFGGAVCFLKKYRSRANYFLVALIIAVSLNNLQYYLRDIGYLDYRELMDIFYIPYASLNCTFLYLYVISLLHPEHTLSLKNKLLFVPFIFFLIATTVYKLMIYYNPSSTILLEDYNDFANAHEFFSVVYSLILVGLSYKTILIYERSGETFNLEIIHHQLRWLKTTLLLIFVIIFLYTYLMVRVLLYPDVLISFYALWIGNSFMIYWLGHIGIYKYGIHKERENIRKFSIINTIEKPICKRKNENIQKLQKLLFDEKRFLDNQMSLETAASELEVSKGHLSRTINSELGMSFNDYINSLRVEEAKSYLRHPDFSNYTLEAIGLEAGFNSKSTFYATFKKSTGLTPLQFKNSSSN